MSSRTGKPSSDNPIHRLEQSLKELAGDRKRIVVFYEKGKGWCVTDDVNVLEPKMGKSTPEYRIICYRDWFRKSLQEAVDTLGHIHLLRAQEISRQ
jgi:hypothetical protein